MLKHKPTLGGTGDAQKPHRIWHRAPDRSEVVRRRLQWLREVEAFQSSEGSFHALTTAALSITSHHIDDIFHGNIRSWLFNVASLVAQVRFRQMQGVVNLESQMSLNPGGRFLLHTLLSQVDTLYYFGLDTRLPRLFVDKGLLAWHVNDRFERTGFRSAALFKLGIPGA